MQRRSLLATAAGLAATTLAGCSGDGDSEPDSDTDPESDQDPESDSDSEPDHDASWTDGEGGLVTDELVAVHVDRLVEAGSFRSVSTIESTHEGDEDPSSWFYDQTIESAFDLDAQLQQYAHEQHDSPDGEPPLSQYAYVTDETEYVRTEEGETVHYDVTDHERDAEGFERAMRNDAAGGATPLESWDVSFAGETEIDGTAAFTYTGDRFHGEFEVPEEIESATVAATIDEDGVVHRTEQTFSGTHDGVDAEVTISIGYHDIGETTIEEPEWVEEARREAE